MLVAEALGVSVGNAAILREVEARLRPGRVTAIVGPNGAGKSTLLSCLAGLRRSDQGRILLDGALLQDIASRIRARRIGYLPQDAPLHWNIAVRALVALGRFPYGDAASPEGGAAIDRALVDMSLTDLADRLAGTLSGGERARAMLARVLAGEPDWILVDEPLAALDIAHRHALMIELRAIAARGVGIAIVAHDLALAARFADDAILLDGGALVAAGPAGDVLTPAVLSPVFDLTFAYARIGDASVLVSDPR